MCVCVCVCVCARSASLTAFVRTMTHLPASQLRDWFATLSIPLKCPKAAACTCESLSQDGRVTSNAQRKDPSLISAYRQMDVVVSKWVITTFEP